MVAQVFSCVSLLVWVIYRGGHEVATILMTCLGAAVKRERTFRGELGEEQSSIKSDKLRIFRIRLAFRPNGGMVVCQHISTAGDDV